MRRLVPRPRFSDAIAALALAGLSGCAVPLAPGYAVRKQSLEVRFIAGPPARLAVHASYQLENVGNSELKFIDATLPDEKVFGRQGLRMLVDRRDVGFALAPGGAEGDAASTLRIPYNPLWPRKQKRTLDIEYDLVPASPGGARIAVDGASFELRPSGWFPDLQTPKTLFARDVERPDPTLVSIRVPARFLVDSGGQPRGTRKLGGEVEHRFRLGKRDLDPFVVAGKYDEGRVKTPDGEADFWTFEPLPPDATRAAGARLVATMKAYREAFGPVEKKARPVRLVETSAQLRSDSGLAGVPAGAAFPGGALVNREAIELGVSSEPFLVLAEHELAHTWFGEQVILRPEADLVMREGLADYATIVAAEARAGEPARRQRVIELLRRYDEARVRAAEKPLRALSPADPWEQRRFAFTKGPLFFIVLEDECGKASARRGLANLVSALRGEPVGWIELRAALEAETGKDLAGLFRVWLDGTGIPEKFRAEYGNEVPAGRRHL